MLNVNDTLKQSIIQLGEAIDMSDLISSFLIFQTDNFDACKAIDQISVLRNHLEKIQDDIEKSIVANN